MKNVLYPSGRLYFSPLFTFLMLTGFFVLPYLSYADGVLDCQGDIMLTTQAEVDLELQLTATPLDPNLYTNTTLTLEISNTGGEDATGIVIDFPIPPGYALVKKSKSLGHYTTWPTGLWTIDLLYPGQTATLQVTIFALTDNPIPVYAQVIAQDQDDLDSQPDNNDCLATLPNCTVAEDDEALLILNEGNAPLLLPDLLLSNLAGPDIGEVGKKYFFTFHLLNQGTGTDPMDFITSAYLSTDDQLSSDDLETSRLRINGTPLDSLTDLIIQVDIPPGHTPGDYFIILKTDKDDVIAELAEDNNTGAIAFVITYPNAANCSGDIALTTQAEMDAFGPCVVYDGSIIISGDISDLSSLVGLQEVNGHFGLAYAPSITDLNPLSDLQRVNEDFAISNCDGISDLSGLERLSYVGRRTVVLDNENLLSLAGLENLSYTQTIQVSANTKLRSISSLNKITTLSDGLLLFLNPALENLNGFKGLVNVNNLLVIDQNENLNSIASLRNVVTINGFLVIGRNPVLQSLEGLESISQIQALNIINNPQLSDCCAIRDLLNTPGAISGNINIQNNPAFCSSPQDILDNCIASEPDLEVNITASQPDFMPWQILSITVEVTNTGGSAASDIIVDFPLPFGTVFSGGNEYSASQGSYAPYGNRQWNLGNLDPGATALITFYLFTKQESFLLAYAEVINMTELDNDSTPDNGTCQNNDPANCTANEDEEALIVLQASTNRQISGEVTAAAPLIRRLSPNPASEQIDLIVESRQAGVYVLEVYSSWGKLEKKESFEISPGVNFLQVPVASLSSGTYFLMLVDGHRRSRINHFVKLTP